MSVIGLNGEISFLLYVMFWTILAMMLVLLFALKQVIKTQQFIKNIDLNIQRLVVEVLKDEERILDDIEKPIKVKSKLKKKK